MSTTTRTTCRHCCEVILQRSSDGLWFSKGITGPVTSDCNDAPDGTHEPAGDADRARQITGINVASIDGDVLIKYASNDGPVAIRLARADAGQLGAALMEIAGMSGHAEDR